MKMRYVFSLYFLALLSMGGFHLAITPVFEAFDENAHYSYIRQIAYQGRIPVRGESFIDQVVADYQGPVSYSSGKPPFDGGMVYHKFFKRQDLVDSYIIQYRQNILPASFAPSLIENWQSQHPPLYYALMAPILRVVDQEPLVTQIFVLRLVSYLLALSGMALGILAILQREQAGVPTRNFPLLLGFVIYPFMMPMFFPEFARIGNDSLCVFLVGLLAYLLSKWSTDDSGVKLSIAIGTTLGFGLLTKAFFIPIAVAIFMFIFMRSLIERPAGEKVAKMQLRFLYLLLPTMAIGGGWYVYNYLALGDWSGSNVAIELARKGGFLENISNTFSLSTFLRGVATSLVTFVWGGTWSLTHLPHVLYIPLLVAITWVFGAFCLQLRKVPFTDTLWLSVWLIFFFGAGISWHAIVNIALGIEGNANTPGWYLHILLPFLAPAIGAGTLSIVRNLKSKLIFLGFLAYSVIFYLVAIWSQLALFYGCAIKGDDKQYVFQSNLMCFDHTPQMIDHLSLLGYPSLGVVGFSGWVVCSVLLVIELKRLSANSSDLNGLFSQCKTRDK